MAKLDEIVHFLDIELKVKEVPDYGGALNGLQLENKSGEVYKVITAVDASLPVIEKAANEGADLLIVHHGMFWHGAQRLVNAQFEKLRIAMDSNMAIYSAHIPLDIHSEWGNNALLCGAIGMQNAEAYYEWKGIQLGLKQQMPGSLSDLISSVEQAVGREVHFCPGRKSDKVGIVGVITGGAGSEIQAMADEGVDTFITGEGPHWSCPLAEELGVNLIYAGHYATETFGVIKLGNILTEKWGAENQFIDHTTGL